MSIKRRAAIVLVGAAFLSTFLWAFFGLQWWVEPDSALKEFIILTTHIAGMIFGTIFLIIESD